MAKTELRRHSWPLQHLLSRSSPENPKRTVNTQLVRLVTSRRSEDLAFGIILSQYSFAFSNKLLKLISLVVVDLSRRGTNETD